MKEKNYGSTFSAEHPRVTIRSVVEQTSIETIERPLQLFSNIQISRLDKYINRKLFGLNSKLGNEKQSFASKCTNFIGEITILIVDFS